MNISVFGLGYVGAVTSACLSNMDHSVIGVDVQDGKVDAINDGRSPIVEPGLNELLASGQTAGRLSATTDVEAAISASEFSIVCVGTPSLESGHLNLSFVREVCSQIANAVAVKGSSHTLVLRSTMLPGSTRQLVDQFFSHLIDQSLLEVAYCPEFLREGTALKDYHDPSLAVSGSIDGTVISTVDLVMGTAEWGRWESAELTKYSCNYFHALKVAFANEIGRFSKHFGVDGISLMNSLCSDTRLNISNYYMRPGNPFGGSCLPKDVSALTSHARQEGISAPILENVLASNQAHLDSLLQSILKTGKSRVLILGLSFKKDTDDLRGSPMVSVAETLLGRGFEVGVYDPTFSLDGLIGSNESEINRRMPHLAKLLHDDLGEATKNYDVLVVAHSNTPINVMKEYITEDHHIIDVNGWKELSELRSSYEGFCW
jgi:GDP-mannose 6-dehydrogenase